MKFTSISCNKSYKFIRFNLGYCFLLTSPSAMKSEESAEKKSKELERRVLEKVEHTITSINVSKHVDEVITALYSLAACLFPLNPHSFSGSRLNILSFHFGNFNFVGYSVKRHFCKKF